MVCKLRNLLPASRVSEKPYNILIDLSNILKSLERNILFDFRLKSVRSS